MIAAALQLNSQGLSSTKLYNYIRTAHRKNVKLLVLGEYILNPFFKELQNLSLEMIDESSKMQIKVLKDSARDYDMHIIAPLVVVKNKKPYKTIIKFSPKSIAYYEQQFLINYPHWNEEKFFANKSTSLHSPLTFKIGDLRFGVIGGYELHFDPIWRFVEEKSIDCMIVPSVSTFSLFHVGKHLCEHERLHLTAMCYGANRHRYIPRSGPDHYSGVLRRIRSQPSPGRVTWNHLGNPRREL